MTEVRALRVEHGRDGAWLRITLDAGRGNVLTTDVLSELREVVATAAADAELRALLFDHTGEHMSYGASIEEHRADQVSELLLRFRLFARDLLRSGIPTVCAARGLCVGGGLELAALCDRLIVSPDARLGHPEIELGVFAPLGSLLLPRIVGPRLASDLLLTGRKLDAGEALATGLVSEVDDAPSVAGTAWIETWLVPKSASSLRHAARAARAGWAERFLEDLETLEQSYVGELMRTQDANEGVEAFLAKRAARWRHR